MRGGGRVVIGDRLEIIGTQDEVAHRLRDRRIMAGELVKLPLHARVSLGLLAGTFDDQRQGGMKTDVVGIAGGVFGKAGLVGAGLNAGPSPWPV
jgi:hypothetical protein